MHLLQAALGRQLAPHCAFRDAPLLAEGLGHDLAVLLKSSQQKLLALGGQHEGLDKVIARSGMFVLDIRVDKL